ncbi:hypothetical protein [Halosimplex halophilum]|uniref:hypothetical protein n=1 Tax=Halosimplex halophilum TaxID=2559572 RepID=UPI00107F9267|nr:hypothetical protein [Halosimplex halophilum]
MATSIDRGFLRIDDPRALLVGDRPRRTALALLASAVLVVAGAAVRSAFIRSYYDPGFPLSQWSVVNTALGLSVPGFLVVVALTAGYAYLNRGYLPTLALGTASKLGAASVVVTDLSVGRGGPLGDPTGTVTLGYQLPSAAAFVPPVLVLSTLGFALGLLVRRYRRTRDGTR